MRQAGGADGHPAPQHGRLLPLAPERALNQPHRSGADILGQGVDHQFIVKAGGRGIADMHLGHGIGALARFHRRALVNPQQAHQIGTRPFEPFEIIGMIGHARQIGVLVKHAQRIEVASARLGPALDQDATGRGKRGDVGQVGHAGANLARPCYKGQGCTRQYGQFGVNSQAIIRPSACPPNRWTCRCGTSCPPSAPTLASRR